MSSAHLYLDSFPEQHKVEDEDVVKYYHEQKFQELNSVNICKDNNGRVTATFGQDSWNCFPFSRKVARNHLSFKELSNTLPLQRELKLITYGWLFNKSSKQRKAITFSTLNTRHNKLKQVYKFLDKNNLTSLRELSKPVFWKKFTDHLIDKEYSKSTIEQYFIAINKAIEFTPWHKISFGFEKSIETAKVANQLNSSSSQQTLIIPERICNMIYEKAIKLVDEAHPYRELIAETENALQKNYLMGKHIVDQKNQNGTTFSFIRKNGEIDRQQYARHIIENQPQKPKDIIFHLDQNLPSVSLKDGNDFQRYLGQLITASYIVCGGFSGMRDSELDKLTPKSYYKDSFEGREYHMLQSHTFKLKKKRDTWVTAASSKTAIELMSTLTQRWRKEVDYPDEKYTNTIWVNNIARSTPPVLITKWNDRLARFCSQFEFCVTTADLQECIDFNPRSREKIKKTIKVGKPWPLKTHQFRRTLAFYFTKNRLGTLSALKQQFKHLNTVMTEWYTNGGRLASLRGLKVDKLVQRTLDEINMETTANKIFRQWHSDETLSGSYGKAIIKMRNDIPTIYSSWDTIHKAVQDGKLTLHGSLHSYCTSGYQCEMGGVVAPQFCVACGSGSSIIDEKQARWWQRKHSSLIAYMSSSDDISVSERSHYITQIRAAENVMTDFDMPFTPFEPDLKVVNS